VRLNDSLYCGLLDDIFLFYVGMNGFCIHFDFICYVYHITSQMRKHILCFYVINRTNIIKYYILLCSYNK